MKLYDYPKVNRELKDLSLREQMEARLRQIDEHRYYSDKSIAGMSDYALLTAFEVMVMGIGNDTADEAAKEAWDGGMKFGQERMLRQINESYNTNHTNSKSTI